MSKVPSPCIDVCKYKLKGGHCIGCGMTKPQKKAFKALDGKRVKRAFLHDLLEQQTRLGGKFKHWASAYRRKCEKKGTPCPIDEVSAAE
jgi:hypothetical protein